MKRKTRIVVLKIPWNSDLIIRLLIITCCLLVVGTTIFVIYRSFFSKPTLGVVHNKAVVIDPGHGGIDGGASDNNGLLEKNINLDISLKLKKELKNKDIKVIMTRKKDVSLEEKSNLNSTRYRRDLDARKNIIDENNVNCFVSIHTNSNPNDLNDNGIIVFHYPGSEKSKNLADIIGKEISNTFSTLNDYGNIRIQILPGNYYILRETNKPGVLIEVGFITNYRNKQLLLNDKYTDKLTNAISNGINKYITEDKYTPDNKLKYDELDDIEIIE